MLWVSWCDGESEREIDLYYHQHGRHLCTPTVAANDVAVVVLVLVVPVVVVEDG